MNREIMQKKNKTKLVLVDEGYDAALCKFIASIPMKTALLDLIFDFSPSFFEALKVTGKNLQVYASFVDDQIKGIGVESSFQGYSNGCQRPLGFLGGLRIAQDVKAGLTLYRMYKMFFECKLEVDYYLTVIFESNKAALNTIAANRKGMPHYHNQGRIFSYLIPSKRVKSVNSGINVEFFNDDLNSIIDYLNKFFQSMQFSPHLAQEDFFSGRLSQLDPKNIITCYKDKKLQGVAAIWDQNNFRRIVVKEYHGVAKYMRPLLNIMSHNALPKAGSAMRFAYLSLVACEDPVVFQSMIEFSRNAILGKSDFLLVSVHERNPLCKVLMTYNKHPTTGKLFTVSYGELPVLDDRLPYVDMSLM